MQLGNVKDDLPSNLYSRCCAFYFPSVLRAMSSCDNAWNDMSDLYIRLSHHNDPIVRRSLAHSLHEVAHLVGPKLTQKFLIPVQTQFLSDRDDIRMGVLHHLASFCDALPPDERVVQAMVRVCAALHV